jgi:hypothetical protein
MLVEVRDRPLPQRTTGNNGSRAGVALRAPSAYCISFAGRSNVEVDRL